MDIFKSNILVGIAAGVAATALAPVVVPIVVAVARPMTKSLLKSGVLLYEKGREALAGAGEELEDLIAEVRSEMVHKPGEEPVAATVEGAQQVRDIASASARGNGAQM